MQDTNNQLHNIPTDSLDHSQLNFSFYRSIEPIGSLWDSLTGDNIFLSSKFYKALELAPPSGTSYVYGIVNYKDQAIGCLYFQIKKINLRESLRFKNGGLFNAIKKSLASLVHFNTLVGGNMTLTGTYGFYFIPSFSSCYDNICSLSINHLLQYLKKSKINISGVVLKDFCEDNKPNLKHAGYSTFCVQPNMVMNINSDWLDFADYISAMKSKYRTRVRRARKKSASLIRRVLNLDQIKENNSKIAQLYKNVADGAGFNLFTLPEDYFWSLQKHLGDAMRLTAFYDGDEMVGFYTSIINHNDLDAHFLGYHLDYNRNHQIYLNMLYDLVEEAISFRSEKLIMSRTAMEIKSSVGAEAKEMYVLMKSTNGFMNKILPKALDYFVPVSNWKSRSPFS